MIDSPAEIVRSYRMAADPKKQIKVLAELNACSVKEIRRVLVGEGVLPRETEVPDEPKKAARKRFDEETARMLYEEGLDDAAIAKATGMTAHTVAKWRSRNGLRKKARKPRMKKQVDVPDTKPSEEAPDVQKIPAVGEAVEVTEPDFTKSAAPEPRTVTVEELMNDYSPRAMELAEKYLKELKPNIAGWEADFGKEMMTKNKAWLNMTWSGDAIWAIEEANAVGVDLDYVVPEEGSNIWYDGWVIPKYAKNPKAASYFINFMCRPDIALRNMDFCGYVSSVATPEILEEKQDTTLTYFSDLSYFFGPDADSIQIDKIQYPDRKVVERCAMIRDSGDKTELVLEMWSRVKGDNLGVGVVIVILVSAGIMVVFTVYRKLQRYQHEKAQYHRRNHRRKK